MRILIVEDEQLSAHNLRVELGRIGYEVTAVARSGEEAIMRIATQLPDLVLMDIDLAGEMNGIETAERIRADFSVPVIFLTAHENLEYLDQAKRTQPFAYLVKPVRPIDLLSTVEMAANRHHIEQKLRQREAWLATTLMRMGDAVIVTDAGGRIEFLNHIAEKMLSLNRNVVGECFSDVVRLKNRLTGEPAGDLVLLAILQGSTMSIGSDLILDTDGYCADIEGEIALSEIDGSLVGTVFTFRDVTVRNYQEEHRFRDQVNGVCARLASAISCEISNTIANAGTLHHARAAESLIRELTSITDRLDQVKAIAVSLPEFLNLNLVLSEVMTAAGRELPPSISLISEVEPDLPHTYADARQLKEALNHLVRYAAESLPKGGSVQLIAETMGYKRVIRNQRAEHFTRLTIRAVSATAEHARVLEFDPTLADKGHENLPDLRLFLVQSILTNAHASFRAQTAGKTGVSFDILLRQSGRGSVSQGDNGSILLLHADDGIRNFMAGNLEHQGYEVLAAGSCEQAFDWANLYPDVINLLIADLDSSPLDLKDLNYIAGNHDGMQMIFTGSPEMIHAARRAWDGIEFQVIEKPFKLTDLLRTTNNTLRLLKVRKPGCETGPPPRLAIVPKPVPNTSEWRVN